MYTKVSIPNKTKLRRLIEVILFCVNCHFQTQRQLNTPPLTGRTCNDLGKGKTCYSDEERRRHVSETSRYTLALGVKSYFPVAMFACSYISI